MSLRNIFMCIVLCLPALSFAEDLEVIGSRLKNPHFKQDGSQYIYAQGYVKLSNGLVGKVSCLPTNHSFMRYIFGLPGADDSLVLILDGVSRTQHQFDADSEAKISVYKTSVFASRDKCESKLAAIQAGTKLRTANNKDLIIVSHDPNDSW